MGYPLGWKWHIHEKGFNYCEYNLPSKEDIQKTPWLCYAFCNHPHLKIKSVTNDFPYPENIEPYKVETQYSTEWVLKQKNVYHVPVFEELIGLQDSYKSIFKHIGGKFSYRM